jgi:hypothetical protein
MPRKLKTFTTTSGFYDLAVAAPTMKAALEFWGSKKNLFAQGFANETDDPDIVTATFAKPGIVLRRAVGGSGMFREDAELPKLAVLEKALKQKSSRAPVGKHPPERKKAKKADPAASRKAAQLYDLAQKRREQEEARAEAQQQKEHERRKQAVEKAVDALGNAREKHNERMDAIAKEREALDRKAEKEKSLWSAEKDRLEVALDNARG